MSKSHRLIALVLALGAVVAVILLRPGRPSGDVAPAQATMETVPVESDAPASSAVPEVNPLPAAPTVAGAEDQLPRLVDLGANYCVPCKMMAPILEELRSEYDGQLIVEVIDVRDNRSAVALYGIRVIPTQIFIDPEGTERFRHEGFMAKDAILEKWRELGVDLPAPAVEGS